MIGRNKRVDRGSLVSWGPEFTAAGIGSTGIGCYFDDPVHEVFGIASRDWQSFYHLTVGGPVEDVRLTTLPAYNFEEER